MSLTPAKTEATSQELHALRDALPLADAPPLNPPSAMLLAACRRRWMFMPTPSRYGALGTI